MKTLTRIFLVVTLAFGPLGLSSILSANEVAPNVIRGNYQEATWLAFQLAKQAESLSHQDPYDQPGGIFDDYDYGHDYDHDDHFPGPRRPGRHDPSELIYAAQDLQQASMDLYYTLRFPGRNGGIDNDSQIFRHFRNVRGAYRRLSFVAPYWKITHITNTFERLERALYGYGSRW
ncbi:MAG: hypothetical protein HRU09_20015 [Oligoflexales bacterium]|nr:hypothetical protein [Oligoflexales bacterium]